MPNSYTPTAKMIRTLFEQHGFTEYKSVKELAIGGYVFFRKHEDGRLQMAYVFSWSNFRIAEKEGSSPCIFWVRSTLNVTRSQDEAWRSAPHGISVGIPFKPDQWDVVTAKFVNLVMPAFDAPDGDGEHLLELANAQA
jgi:hypothetical protein